METMYQDASWCVKLYRWLRYKPVYSILCGWDLFLWLLCGAKVTELETRLGHIQHIWRYYMALADAKMLHYWTLEEIIADLKAKK